MTRRNGLDLESAGRTVVGMAAHPAPPLAVSESEAEALRAMTRGTSEQRTVMRARIILRAADERDVGDWWATLDSNQ